MQLLPAFGSRRPSRAHGGLEAKTGSHETASRLEGALLWTFRAYAPEFASSSAMLS